MSFSKAPKFKSNNPLSPLPFSALLPAILITAIIIYILINNSSLNSTHIQPFQTKITITFPTSSNKTSSLGINTNEITEENASIPFVDLFKNTTPFQEQHELSSKEVTYDENGWPNNLHGGYAGTKFIGKIPFKALPKGNYTILYEGEGEIQYSDDARLVYQSAGKDIIQLDPINENEVNASLTIVQSNPNNYIRNIHILLPGGICQGQPFTPVTNVGDCRSIDDYLAFSKYYESIIFNPDYLNFMKDFSVIRFMSMSGISHHSAKHWKSRPNLQEASWGGANGSRGAPIEIQVELANRLQAHPWFNIPHAADDHYIQSFANYIHENLSPNLKPFIEYTNEAWNSNFNHSDYTQKHGIAEGLDKNVLEAGYKYYAQRSTETFGIWEGIYGNTSGFTRVIGGWATRPNVSAKILNYQNTYKHVDVLAIAPYVSGDIKGLREAKTVDDIFNLLTDKYAYQSITEVSKDIHQHAKLAKAFGLKLLAYEGGQGLIDWNAQQTEQHPNPLFFAANRDFRMQNIYQELLNQWKNAGGETFILFSAPRTCQWFGCWGLKEYITQDIDVAPKYAAVKQFIQDNPPWWNNQPLKASPSDIKEYLYQDTPDKAHIVIQPTTIDSESLFSLDSPNSLNMLIEGNEWNKKDISGQWQIKWDTQNLYLNVDVHDDQLVSDSKNPKHDDSIEFFIDTDNSRQPKYDSINDFHYIFSWDSDEIIYKGKNTVKTTSTDFPVEMNKTADGYHLNASIPWDILGVKPKVSGKMGVEIIINDDDDGGQREARIGWASVDDTAKKDPRSFAVVLISGK